MKEQSLWKFAKREPTERPKAVSNNEESRFVGEHDNIATYNPNTLVVFLCTHRGTLELSWPFVWCRRVDLCGFTGSGSVVKVKSGRGEGRREDRGTSSFHSRLNVPFYYIYGMVF